MDKETPGLVQEIELARCALRVAEQRFDKFSEAQRAQIGNALADLMGILKALPVTADEIVALRRADALLSEEAKRFKTVSELTSDYAYVFRIEPDGRLICEWVTDAFTVLTGLSLDEATSTRLIDLWLELVHPEDSAAARRHFEAYVDGWPDTAEFRIVNRCGELHWLRDYGRPEWDEAQQRVTRVYGAARDITARKEMETELRAGEERYRKLLNAISDSIAVFDAEWRYVIVNEAHEQGLGLPAEALLNNRLLDLFPDLEGTPFFETYRRVMETRQPDSIIDKYTFPNGQAGWYEVHVYPVPEGILCISRNITERVQAQEALQQSEKRFRLLAEHAQDIIYQYLLVPTPGFEYVSPAATAITGYAPEEYYADPALGLKMVHPDDRPLLQQLSDVQEFSRPTIMRWQRKDGTTIWIEQRNVPIYDQQGNWVAIEGIARDVTERKKAEEQHVDLAVEHEKVKMLQQFIGDASHDLKTPITTMKTSLYLLEKSPSPEMHHAHKEILKAQVDHLERLLEDLLHMSRLDQSAEFVFRKMNLNSLVGEIVQNYTPFAERKGHAPVFVPGIPDPVVLADGVTLAQAVANLLSNAVNYTPLGGSVTARTWVRDQQAIIEVQDSGMGIHPDELPHIFERFYRADRARSTGTGGVGMGLPIAKKIVEAHQGTIEVESEPGQGSTFRIVLPLANGQ